MLTFGTLAAKGVIKDVGRREYVSMRPLFKADREENLRRTVVNDIPERKKYSIVWQSKLKGKKRFVQLP